MATYISSQLTTGDNPATSGTLEANGDNWLGICRFRPSYKRYLKNIRFYVYNSSPGTNLKWRVKTWSTGTSLGEGQVALSNMINQYLDIPIPDIYLLSAEDYIIEIWMDNGINFGFNHNGVYQTNSGGLSFFQDQNVKWMVIALTTQDPNTAPTIPGTFTQPISGTTLEIGDQRALTWGMSNDPDYNFSTYILDVQIDGGTWKNITSTVNLSYTYTIPTAKTLKFRVKARDKEGAESAYRESAVFDVTKKLYYWSKYNISRQEVRTEPPWSLDAQYDKGTVNDAWGYPSYSFDPNTGTYKESGTPRYANYQPGFVGYTVYNGGNSIQKFELGTETLYQYSKSGFLQSFRDVRGSLIQSGIIAEEGTYPTDGQQSGYWWVRGSRVKDSIPPPGPFTVPTQGTVLKPGETVSVTWGPSSAPNLAGYTLEYKHNSDGSSTGWTKLSEINALTRGIIITKDKTLTNIQFRVYARNTVNTSSDYVYSDVYEIQHNVIPTILLNTANNFTMSETEGQNEVLVDGSARDTDANDNIIIKMQINDGTIRNIQSGLSDGSTPIEFSKKITYSNKRVYDGATPISNDLAENVDHTLKVWADDGQGGISTVEERIFRVIHNRPPVISGTDEDLGELLEIPSITYQVDDPEKQTATITERINGQVIRTFDAELGTEYKIEIPIEMWIPLQLEQEHKLTIEAKDSFGAKSTRTYTFTRTEDTIQLELKNPFVTDIAATRILVTPDVYLPIGSTIVIEACNNAFDEVPTWEDVTGMAMNKRGFHFTNTEKTAEQWGINIRFTLHKGTAHDQVKFNGFGGAFD
ncbi:fibronectin type III domain-containing protein [Heyndrickxia oleronia]|uniref:fibronectin type III domain-containing protein n=1 Tax=Heyndrickxia oleronia TaxID=38875 RepID=UPI001ADED775|nr:fibronectin type III domain-containing protein [Heyndrickxia oleronia]MEC1373427.1 fibronectin type III domain-containing protein [Heyndrickxia oleronia]